MCSSRAPKFRFAVGALSRKLLGPNRSLPTACRRSLVRKPRKHLMQQKQEEMGTAISTGPTKRLAGTKAELHGRYGDEHWAAPRIAVRCDEEARPGYQTRSANEYLDEPEVLAAKVQVLARLLRESKN